MSVNQNAASGKILKVAGISLGALALVGAVTWASLRGSSSAPRPELAANLEGAPIDSPAAAPLAEPPPPAPEGAPSAAPSTPSDSTITLKPADPAKTADQLEQFSAAAAKAIADPSKDSLDLTFADISSYVYQFPDDAEIKRLAEEKDPAKKKTDRIPEKIWELEGKKVTMQGFMLPYEVVEGKIKSFVLVKNQMACCYGVMPMMNEWLYVTMADGKNTDFFPDIPIIVTGKFQVGEDVQEGTVVSIYRMQGMEVTPTAAPNKDFLSFGF